MPTCVLESLCLKLFCSFLAFTCHGHARGMMTVQQPLTARPSVGLLSQFNYYYEYSVCRQIRRRSNKPTSVHADVQPCGTLSSHVESYYSSDRDNDYNESVFSYLRTLTRWHCPRSHDAADISCPPGPQQQTYSSGLELTVTVDRHVANSHDRDGTDKRTDRRTSDGHSK